MSLLELKGVDVFYQDMPAVRDLCLHIDQGECVCMVGANGAGKTTTLNTISGLLQPRRGEIWFEGTRVDAMPAHELANRGLVQVPEGRRLFPLMSVRDNLNIGAFSPRVAKSARHRLGEVLELLPILQDRQNQIALTLSGGEQQLLAIGRALMAQPKILMLDEPSLGLAPIIVKNVFELVQTINRQGTTVLLVEQNVRHSLELAHRGYVLENGKITLEDTAAELLKNPKVKSAYLGI